MLPLFRKSKKRDNEIADKKKIIRNFEYHPKIILAWAKALEGNKDLLNYLKDNGFPELYMATYAIRLKDEARTWLIDNGFPHIMAMINAAEGNESAQKWLIDNDFKLLHAMSLAIDGHPEGFFYIRKFSSQEIFILTSVIKEIKDEIEENHNDIHKRSLE